MGKEKDYILPGADDEADRLCNTPIGLFETKSGFIFSSIALATGIVFGVVKLYSLINAKIDANPIISSTQIQTQTVLLDKQKIGNSDVRLNGIQNPKKTIVSSNKDNLNNLLFIQLNSSSGKLEFKLNDGFPIVPYLSNEYSIDNNAGDYLRWNTSMPMIKEIITPRDTSKPLSLTPLKLVSKPKKSDSISKSVEVKVPFTFKGNHYVAVSNSQLFEKIPDLKSILSNEYLTCMPTGEGEYVASTIGGYNYFCSDSCGEFVELPLFESSKPFISGKCNISIHKDFDLIGQVNIKK